MRHNSDRTNILSRLQHDIRGEWTLGHTGKCQGALLLTEDSLNGGFENELFLRTYSSQSFMKLSI